jgi:hypothetical protein
MACTVDYVDKIQAIGATGDERERDCFAWDEFGCLTADAAEMDQVRESLFEAMRSG